MAQQNHLLHPVHDMSSFEVNSLVSWPQKSWEKVPVQSWVVVTHKSWRNVLLKSRLSWTRNLNVELLQSWLSWKYKSCKSRLCKSWEEVLVKSRKSWEQNSCWSTASKPCTNATREGLGSHSCGLGLLGQSLEYTEWIRLTLSLTQQAAQMWHSHFFSPRSIA